MLAAEFHCLLKVSLSNWLHVRDSISVWKRSETCTIVFAADDDDDEDGDGEDQEDENCNTDIPVETSSRHIILADARGFTAQSKKVSKRKESSGRIKSDTKKISFEGCSKYRL
jgi:hypothetical protein